MQWHQCMTEAMKVPPVPRNAQGRPKKVCPARTKQRTVAGTVIYIGINNNFLTKGKREALAKYRKQMTFILKMSLFDAIKRIINHPRLFLPIADEIYWSDSAREFFQKDHWSKNIQNELLIDFFRENECFYSCKPLDDDGSEKFVNTESLDPFYEYFIEHMSPYSVFYNKNIGCFKWVTGKGYLLSIIEITTEDGFEINVYIDYPDHTSQASTTFIPTVLKTLLSDCKRID